jgi:hypothetical protein
MREIKFRAWDKENKVYIVPTEKNGGNVLNAWIDSESDVSIIEQFTGLHDRNGKEIYENDEESRGLIDFRDGAWKLIHNPECRSEIEGECRWDYLYDFKSEDLEVIGTIHDEVKK